MSAAEPLAVSRMTGTDRRSRIWRIDLDAVQVGHDDVEQDDVGPDLLGLGQRLLAAGGRHDPEALVGEGHRDELGDALLVVRDQHQRLSAHGLAFLLPPARRAAPRAGPVGTLLCALSCRKARGHRRRASPRPPTRDGPAVPRRSPSLRREGRRAPRDWHTINLSAIRRTRRLGVKPASARPRLGPCDARPATPVRSRWRAR